MADYIKEIRALVGHKPLILVAAGGAIFNNHDEILLQERTDTHNWSMPGGFMEYGETLVETAKREVAEDSGLEVKIDHLITISDNGFFTYPNGDQAQIINFVYRVTPIGGALIEKPTDETISMAYFTESDLPPLLNQQVEDAVHAAFLDKLKNN